MLSETRIERNRDNLGSRLKNARIREGYTQKGLADALGLEYYTMISQMELGYISIPAALWVNISMVLNMDRSEWVLSCLAEYQPDLYEALFNKRGINEMTFFLNKLHKGQLDRLRVPE